MEPTAEQKAVVEAATTPKGNLRVIAFAGSGKTTTLKMTAKAWPRTKERGLYLAFNKRTADDASREFPRQVDCRTAHSLAYRGLGIGGSGLAKKLQVKQRPTDLLDMLRIDSEVCGRSKWNTISGIRQTLRNFTHSADAEMGAGHVSRSHTIPIEDSMVRMEYAGYLLEKARQLWSMTIDKARVDVAMAHDDYLKLWQLADPQLPVDFIMFDEAQDADPVIQDVVSKQYQAKLIYVGDPHQQIYSWRGAVDAMKKLDAVSRYLTASFRFGTEIARVASDILLWKGEAETVKGLALSPGMVGNCVVDRGRPYALICRSNYGVFMSALLAVEERQSFSVVGGLEEPIQLLEGAYYLICENNPRMVQAPALKVFQTGDELIQASEEDQALQGLIRIVQKHGREIPRMCMTLRSAGDAGASAHITITTCHKAKGREWPQVVLYEDFRGPLAESGGVPVVPADEELNLLYVAATRARERLDVNSAVAEYMDGECLMERFRAMDTAKPSPAMKNFLGRASFAASKRGLSWE